MKGHIKYQCRSCGLMSIQWSGICHDCKEWNTFEVYDISKNIDSINDNISCPIALCDITDESKEFYKTNLRGFDHCLGGGILYGSLILLSGDPGVGKTTLLSTVLKGLPNNEKYLFVSGEETSNQLGMRFSRLNITNENIFVSNETNWEKIQLQIKKLGPKLVVLDSIQVLFDTEEGHSQGSLSGVKSLVQKILTEAKQNNITFIIICHITKSGDIAGPKNLEHMVDIVLYLEKIDLNIRILKSFKNRFSQTTNIGTFKMTNLGIETFDSNHIFIKSLDKINQAGHLLACGFDETRLVLYKVESLIVPMTKNNQNIICSGIEKNRVIILLAICEKVLNIKLSDFDVYINLIGAFKKINRMSDLSIIMSLLRSYKNIIIDKKYIFIGEVNLSGHFINKDIQFNKELDNIQNAVLISAGPNKMKNINTSIEIKEYDHLLDLYSDFF